MPTGPRVLLIDGMAETQQVLQAVLEPRGCQINRFRRSAEHPLSAETEPPQLLIIDVDESPEDIDTTTAASSPWEQLPRVLIGSSSVPVANSNTRFLEKPFEYPALVAAVEELLDARRAA